MDWINDCDLFSIGRDFDLFCESEGLFVVFADFNDVECVDCKLISDTLLMNPPRRVFLGR